MLTPKIMETLQTCIWKLVLELLKVKIQDAEVVPINLLLKTCVTKSNEFITITLITQRQPKANGHNFSTVPAAAISKLITMTTVSQLFRPYFASLAWHSGWTSQPSLHPINGKINSWLNMKYFMPQFSNFDKEHPSK